MKTKSPLPIPAQMALRKLGQDICDARRRRRITTQLMSERAGVSRATIGKIEKGDPTTSIGAYAAALFAVGMIQRLSELADAMHDLTGRQLQEENLPQRVRIPSAHKKKNDD